MYNKIFTKILDSSIWLEADQTRIIWLTMLASMDQDGFCQFASAANLAHRAIVPIEAAETAIKVLESPDPHSSDPDNEGRRIERVNGGWMVLNASKYREMVTAAESRRKNLERVQRHRKKLAETKCNASVMTRNDSVMQSEAGALADTLKPSAQKPRGPKPNSQMAKASGETRHSRLQGMIMTWYQEWAGVQCPWNGAEGKQLQALIKSTPDWPDQNFVTCLINLGKSPEYVPQGSSPHEWLSKIPKFLKGPLDRYGRPAGNHKAVAPAVVSSKAADDELKRQGLIR